MARGGGLLRQQTVPRAGGPTGEDAAERAEGASDGMVLPEPGDPVVRQQPGTGPEVAPGAALVQKDSRGHVHRDAWGNAAVVVAPEAFRRSGAKGHKRGNSGKAAERNGSSRMRWTPGKGKGDPSGC